jgi:hypothetical protein
LCNAIETEGVSGFADDMAEADEVLPSPDSFDVTPNVAPGANGSAGAGATVS